METKDKFNSFAVIGLGRFGSQLASRLYEQGKDVLIIDRREEYVQALADHATRAAMADASNKEVLMSLGVQNVDCAIVSIASDLASSVLVTMNLKTIGVPHIICKAHDETHREILEKLGADEVIIPERAVADKLAHNLTAQNFMEYIELSADYAIVERKVPASWVGKTILELNIRAKYGLNIIAFKRGSGITVSPGANDAFAEGDVLVLLGGNESLKKIERL
ncbi:MAG: TrkA family potassium uptake protein [Clostridiales bacterium]|nr:TrkA family potassium uptake protein [Candidatus Coliplasma caballi]